MSTELVMREQQRPLAVVPRYSTEQVQLLADTIARGCDENEFKLFMEISRFSRLNPFIGQIRPVKRWNSDLGREAMVIQVGIDGYRSMASRTGELAGIEDALFDSEDEPQPKWAKVTVYRWSHGEKIPYTATARWSEYVQMKKGGVPNSMWCRMPYLMLAKCAEALALRKAFPDELAGVYTEEEMGQADMDVPPSKPPVTQPKRASEKQAEPSHSPQQNGQEPPPAREPEKQKAEPEKVSGVIEALKEGKDGAIWVMFDKKWVALKAEFVDDTIRVGETLTVKAIKGFNERIGGYFVATSVLENAATENAGTDKLVQELDAAMSQEVPREQQEENVSQEPQGDQGTINLGELMENGAVRKASDLPSNGGAKKIGTGRAQRLYALINQNKKTTGFSEDAIKKIIAQPPLSLEHLTDLPMEMYPQFEKLATGETDWRPFLEG